MSDFHQSLGRPTDWANVHSQAGSNPRVAVENLIDFMVASVEAARASDEPFYHLEFDRVFPDDIYAAMLAAMPPARQYRPMSGPSERRALLYKIAPMVQKWGRALPNNLYSRVKLDLYPQTTRQLLPEQRAVWTVVSRALCSERVATALLSRLAPGLRRRFGADFAKVAMYPLPILVRDVPGYSLGPHRDTRWKGITVQFYLPADESNMHIGTVFHERSDDGALSRMQMKFAPNVGYAFAVGDNTWHSVDLVGPEIETRNSIMLTYFVDDGIVRTLRNRGRWAGAVLISECRYWLGQLGPGRTRKSTSRSQIRK